jgi:ribonuclease D
MHSCGQDLEIFHLLFSGIPPNLFDTQIAAAFIGIGDQVSYAMLVEEICNIRLRKAHTRARWCNRPLSSEEISYAEDDVRYLHEIYQKLTADLESLGRRQWFDAEMEILVNSPVFPVNESNAWKRIGSLKFMAGRQLACAKALAGWREKTAQQRDLPRNWIMSDKVLTSIADTLPGTLTDLSSIDEIPDKLVKHQGEQILRIVSASREHNESDRPMGNRRPDAREKAQKKALARILDDAAAAINIPPSVLATRRDLAAMIEGERDLAVLRGWRNDVVGEDLLNYLRAENS